ncbi:MAG: alpha-glucosidase C-terminal domain-containing protein [Candidatus Gastranaerophilaceae bacterium]
MKKKLLSTVVAAALMANGAYARDYVKNDLRSMFLNNEAVIFQINMRSFSAIDLNGNEIIEPEKGEKIGNFLSAIDRLDEFKELGVNAIHVMPITPVGKNDALGTAGSLYAMAKLDAIDPNITDKTSTLTAKQQAKKFIDEAHKRGIRVFIDLPACVSPDMALTRPDLLLTDPKGAYIVPSTWTDVRLMKIVNEDGSLYKPVLQEHKKFIDMLLEIGADGVRADVAPLKPQSFWSEIIHYARNKDPQFMFLAESAEAWAPPKVPSPTINHKQLLDAGFDAYYGSCLNFLNFKSSKDFEKVFEHINGLAKQGKTKALIGCFDTHDLKSAYLGYSPNVIKKKKKFKDNSTYIGYDNIVKNRKQAAYPKFKKRHIPSKNYPQAIMYMNATLPVNPYFVDGFATGDKYDYSYANDDAKTTYTDNLTYSVHPYQLDIFNYSRKPGGNDMKAKAMLKDTIALREKLGNIVTKGSMKFLKTSDKKVFAYERQYENEGIIVIVNANQKSAVNASVCVKNKDKLANYKILTDVQDVTIKNGKLSVSLPEGKAAVIKYTINKNNTGLKI